MTPESLVDRYCAVWNLEDEAGRLALLGEVWTDDATYTDPGVHAASAAELSGHIAGVRKQWPGCRIVRTTKLDVHHGVGRFGWRVELADGSALPEGLDIVTFSQDGTWISRIVGFFGPLKTV